MDDEGIKMQRITILKISFLLRRIGNYIKYFIKSKGKNDTSGPIKINRKPSTMSVCQHVFPSGTTGQMRAPDVAIDQSYYSVIALG